MSFLDSILIYVASLGSFLILDSIWLGKISPKLYKKYIGHLMAKRPNFITAALFYFIFIIGLLVFVVIPSLKMDSVSHALGYGAMYGFFTYSTFDLTSQAIFKNWPSEISFIDILWGTILTCASSILSFGIASHFIL